jgi:hypothetical protein
VTDRPRLLAGAPWRDRYRKPLPSDGARWFEPVHVREPARVREAIAAQVEAGADVVVAPAWLTHRRALMEIGESRRAAEWTRAAVRVAREAVEEGVSRRGEVAEGNAVLVAGPLPDLDARPETGSGRLAERGAAADRDRETQAGILADAGVDLIVVEAHSSVEAGGRAVTAGASTGLEVWATIPSGVGGAVNGESELDRWLEGLAMAGASTVTLEAPEPPISADSSDPFSAIVERSTRRDDRSIGVLLPLGRADAPAGRSRRWLEAGVDVVGISEGATADALKPLREAIDAEMEAGRAAREASEAPWRLWVVEGAERAPTGAAIWLSSDGRAPDQLPTGFAWSVVPIGEAGRLPAGAYRLVVADSEIEVREIVRIVEDGGVAVARLTSEDLPRVDGAQLIDVRRDGTTLMIALRRVG